MTLTIREKEHWKERIAQKIERRVKALIATQQRDYLSTVDCQARGRAIETLGLTENERRRKEIGETIAELNGERDQLEFIAAEKVSSRIDAGRAKGRSWELQSICKLAIESQVTIETRAIMEGDDLGREVLKLRDEQEELLHDR